MDRGWRSTRLHLAVITMALLSAAYMFSRDRTVTFDSYCLWLVAAAGIYTGGATVSKFAKPGGDK